MYVKIIVVAILLGIVGSLAAALVFLIKDHGSSTRTVRALTLRIGASVALFALLMAMWALGLIAPHGIAP